VQKSSQQFVAYCRYGAYIVVFFLGLVIATAQIANAAPKRKAQPAPQPNPKYAAIVIDAHSGKTLYQENANARRYPASMTKMMTLYLLFEALQAGRIAPETPIPVSAYAAARPPTKIGFKAGQTIAVEAAAKALITRSANDVASAVAEYLGGSEARFARNMTKKAHQLGMMNTNFANASGLPDNNNYSTARDMAILSLALREHFPQYYHLFNTSSFVFRGQTIYSHNRLVRNMKGVDGIKTGFIRASGFNVATSMRSEGKSLVAVVMGGRTAASRDEHMRSLLNRYISKGSKTKKKELLVAKAPPLGDSDLPVRVAQITLPEGKGVPVPMSKSAMMVAQVAPKPTMSELDDGQGQNIEAIIGADDTVLAFAPLPQKPDMSALEELEQVMGVRAQSVEKPLSEPQKMPQGEGVAESEVVQIDARPSDREHDALLIAALVKEYPGSQPSILTPNAGWQEKENTVQMLAMLEMPSLIEEPEIDIFTTASISNGKKGWVIQVATAPTVREADMALYKALNVGVERLDSAEPYLQLYEEGEKRYYRARFAGFKSQKSALNSCVALQAKAVNCYVFED